MTQLGWVVRSYLVLVALFALAPLAIVVLISSNQNEYLLFPVRSLSLRWYYQVLGTSAWPAAALLSAALALVVSLVTVCISFAAAFVCRNASGRMTALFDLAVLAPMLLPQAAVSMVLYAAVDSARLKGTLIGIGLAHVIVVLPFGYRPLASALRFFDQSLEEAAMTLGASPWRVFWNVLLPNLHKPLLSAFILTWMLSFDEVTVTAFLVSIDRMTLPVQILQASEDQAAPLLAAVSSLLILVTVLLTVFMQKFIGLKTLVAEKA